MNVPRLVVTAIALFLALAPPVADFNATHVLHPDWPPHARFHTVWLVCANSLIALFAVWLLWWGPMSERARLGVAGGLLPLILAGFFLAAAFLTSYGGGFTDVDAPTVLGLDLNLLSFSVEAVVLAVALAVGLRSPRP